MPEIIRSRWIALAAEMLDVAADHCGSHGHTDGDYFSRWTDAEREEFRRAVAAWKGDDYGLGMPSDYFVMGFLANCLRDVASRVADRGASGGGAIDADAMVRAVPRLRYATASLASIVADLEGLVGVRR